MGRVFYVNFLASWTLAPAHVMIHFLCLLIKDMLMKLTSGYCCTCDMICGVGFFPWAGK